MWPVGLVVLALALVGIGVDRALAWHRADTRVAAGHAAVAAAEREVITLTSVSAATSTHDLAALRAGATGDFAKQLSGQSSAFAKALSQSKVSAKGRVVSSGLASLTGSRAVVVLAATGTVSNTAAKGPSSRSYRLRAEMIERGGRWLVSSLEFVS